MSFLTSRTWRTQGVKRDPPSAPPPGRPEWAPSALRVEGAPPESAPEVSHKLAIRQLAALKEDPLRTPSFDLDFDLDFDLEGHYLGG